MWMLTMKEIEDIFVMSLLACDFQLRSLMTLCALLGLIVWKMYLWILIWGIKFKCYANLKVIMGLKCSQFIYFNLFIHIPGLYCAWFIRAFESTFLVRLKYMKSEQIFKLWASYTCQLCKWLQRKTCYHTLNDSGSHTTRLWFSAHYILHGFLWSMWTLSKTWWLALTFGNWCRLLPNCKPWQKSANSCSVFYQFINISIIHFLSLSYFVLYILYSIYHSFYIVLSFYCFCLSFYIVRSFIL